VTRDADDLYAGEDADEETAPDTTLLSLRGDWRVAATAAETPLAYIADDVTGAKDGTWAILLRGGVFEDASVGYVASTTRPEGPHNVPHMARIKLRLTDSDNGAWLTYQWTGCIEEGFDQSGGAKIAHTTGGDFINLAGQGQQALSFALTEEVWYYMLIDLLGSTQRVKVWLATDPMPADWEQEFAFGGGQNGYASLRLEAEVVAGSGIDIEEIHIGYGTDEGTSGRVYLGIADGTSVAYTSPLQWGPGGPKVYLDGFLTVLKAFDSSVWSFTFDRAPSYGTKIEIEV